MPRPLTQIEGNEAFVYANLGRRNSPNGRNQSGENEGSRDHERERERLKRSREGERKERQLCGKVDTQSVKIANRPNP